MCTAIQYYGDRGFFGRNLDLHLTYGEQVTVTPRHYPFIFKYEGMCSEHSAIIGTAVAIGGVPMYFDAMNEYGVCAAALNFPDCAVYGTAVSGKVSLPSFEVIPYVLCTCRNMSDVRDLLSKLSITSDELSADTPSSPLHWMFSDGKSSLVLEAVEEGVRVYECAVGVLSNSPQFSVHIDNLREHRDEDPFWDYSSESRFMKGVSVRGKMPPTEGEKEGVNAALRILNAVAVPKGSVVKEGLGVHYTRYTSVCSTASGKYYRNTWDDVQMKAFDIFEYDLEGDKITVT